MLSWSQDEPIEVQDFVAESILEANNPDDFDTITLTISNEGLQGHGGPVPDKEESKIHFYQDSEAMGAIVIEDYPTVDNNYLFRDIDKAADRYKEIVEDLASNFASEDRDVEIEHSSCEYREFDFDLPDTLEF